MSEKLSAASTLLPAIAYGDAFGLPAEGKSVEEITEKYGRVTELIAPIDHPFFPYSERGATSDDTQLSLAVAEGLLDSRGFGIDTQVNRHLNAYHATPRILDEMGVETARGWGRSTIRALERLEAGVPYYEAGEKGGSGNGVVMKMAPLALWQTMNEVDPLRRHAQLDVLTSMTHDSEIARFTTQLHGDALDSILRGESMAITVAKGAYRAQHDFPVESAMLLSAVSEPCGSFEELVTRYAEGKPGKKYGFYVPETLAITYDIFLGSGGDFKTAVEWAANLGGDADSTASIVASMIACASDGAFEKPADFTDTQNYLDLTYISEGLERIV